jgi:hypothetical protein
MGSHFIATYSFEVFACFENVADLKVNDFLQRARGEELDVS